MPPANHGTRRVPTTLELTKLFLDAPEAQGKGPVVM